MRILKTLFVLSFTGALLSHLWSCKEGNDDNGLTKGVTDIDGNTYSTITIGTQVWMAENLNVTHYRNGDTIPNVSNDTAWSRLLTGAYCDYDNSPENSTIYGKLYNYFAVGDSRNLAPSGWHVAGNEDWTILIYYLGGNIGAGGKMKETGTAHWNSPNTGADNESGFTALPGGNRISAGTFDYIGHFSNWWSSTQLNSSDAWAYVIDSWHEYLTRYTCSKKVGFSVRCVRD